MSKKTEQEPFEILRKYVQNEESKALRIATKKLKTFSRNLRTNHTEEKFVFEKIR